MNDPVNHPSASAMPSSIRWRAGLKGDSPEKWLEDLKKARWYIDREIRRLEREASAREGSASGAAGLR